MAYPYNPKIAPAIGNGLGGLPAKKIEATTSVFDTFKEMIYITPGQYNFIVPNGVTSVCVVCVGGGGGCGSNTVAGSGGALSYTNNIAVVPGQSIPVIVGEPGTVTIGANGGDSSFGEYCKAGGGKTGNGTTALTGGSVIIGTGGNGGNVPLCSYRNCGGAGAGGYSGAGGNGIASAKGGDGNGGGGSAGGGYSSFSLSGGGVGLYGLGASGSNNETYANQSPGMGGSGGAGGYKYPNPDKSNNSMAFGAGCGCDGGGYGGGGAVRIIWGDGRSFPSNAA